MTAAIWERPLQQQMSTSGPHSSGPHLCGAIAVGARVAALYLQPPGSNAEGAQPIQDRPREPKRSCCCCVDVQLQVRDRSCSQAVTRSRQQQTAACIVSKPLPSAACMRVQYVPCQNTARPPSMLATHSLADATTVLLAVGSCHWCHTAALTPRSLLLSRQPLSKPGCRCRTLLLHCSTASTLDSGLAASCATFSSPPAAEAMVQQSLYICACHFISTAAKPAFPPSAERLCAQRNLASCQARCRPGPKVCTGTLMASACAAAALSAPLCHPKGSGWPAGASA